MRVYIYRVGMASISRPGRALGPWRNQFKWLSVDVIDFHFTRLSWKMNTDHPAPIIFFISLTLFHLFYVLYIVYVYISLNFILIPQHVALMRIMYRVRVVHNRTYVYIE